MAFVLELETSSSQDYTLNHLIAIIRSFELKALVYQKQGRIVAAMDSTSKALQPCLEAIGADLGASCFLSGSRHYQIDDEPEILPEFAYDHPVSLGLCAACQKELFDPSSRRYYYPFTSCAHCGGQYAFFEHYPYKRANTALSIVHECLTCKAEASKHGRHEQHHLMSCHECGIPVRMVHGSSERYANDAGSFRTLFEVAAKALRDGKSVLMKSSMGYRKFYLSQKLHIGSVAMLINASKITSSFSMIESEFHTLLSIERPILHVALKDEALKVRLGFSCDVKYPDDGFNILLCKELDRLGIEMVFYDEADANTAADYLIDFDLSINTQKDLRLFIDKERKLIISGERVVFPAARPQLTSTLSVANGMIGCKDGDVMRFDAMERFESAVAEKVILLEGDDALFEHSNMQSISSDEAMFMAVIAEHNRFGSKMLGACFEGEPSLLYYDGKKIIRVVPPIVFDPAQLLEKIAILREGSDRLVAKITSEHPQLYERLLSLSDRNSALFEAVGVILELEDASYRGVVKEALKFVGKGGLQVDTKVSDNRFDHTAFLASIISYKLANVDNVLLCYSIFESFGDYFSELISEMQAKTKASETALCGSYFANPSLFSRMMRNLKQNPPLLCHNFPLSKESSVVGGVYM